jgi:hypothetical protein
MAEQVEEALLAVDQVVNNLQSGMQGLSMAGAPNVSAAPSAPGPSQLRPLRADQLPSPLAMFPRPTTREEAMEQYIYYTKYLVVHDLPQERMPAIYHFSLEEAKNWVATLGGSVLHDIPPSEEFTLKHPGEPRGPGVQTKFKDPPPLTKEWVEEVKAVPSCITVAVKRIFRHLVDTKAYAEGELFPMQFTNHIADTNLLHHLWSHAELQRTKTPKTQDEYITDVVSLLRRLLVGDSRDPATVAIENLLDRRITQEDQKVAVHAERFRSQARMIPEMEGEMNQIWLCKLFLRGLKPSLQCMCPVDHARREWTSLDDLIAYACIEEDKMSRSLPPPPALLLSQGQGSKRPYMCALQGETPLKRIDYSFPHEYLEIPFNREVKQTCFTHGTCFRCRNVYHMNVVCPHQGSGPPVPPYGEPSCFTPSASWKKQKGNHQPYRQGGPKPTTAFQHQKKPYKGQRRQQLPPPPPAQQ